MIITCACGASIDVASLGESLTVKLLPPATQEVAMRLRAGILGFFDWTIDANDVTRCAKCSAAQAKAAS